MGFDEGKGWVNANGIARLPRLQDGFLWGWPDGSLCNFISFLGWVATRDGTGTRSVK
ncbi:hypothetical protein [Desulfosporosinus nitroreducens]|uniref:Uncharacterized protein n=1 Tax=Desulfosporosinus nitroreducens TaxID=2018668 RepID=A0ABT8QKK3_9FIRM|nr:hypothetical protein [Desulfosporosinus nitroreducens]MDO0821650.1 hypothetical protein [Desulfosporosinus nitroreducens]